jgi:hypothetical protein
LEILLMLQVPASLLQQALLEPRHLAAREQRNAQTANQRQGQAVRKASLRIATRRSWTAGVA